MKNSKYRKHILKAFEKIKNRVESKGGTFWVSPSVKARDGDLMEIGNPDCGLADWFKSNFKCEIEIGDGGSHISSVSGEPKVDYNSLKTAKVAANRMSKKTGNEYTAYKCPKCKGYHIGKD